MNNAPQSPIPNPQSPISNPQSPHCLRVGITGGIGSGKTTVCRIFESLGIPVYYADEWAKWLITNDDAVKKGMVEIFGTEAYLPDGTYNREYIARIVFENKAKLDALNALVHPAVERHSRQWHEGQSASGVPYTLKEAALLIESGGHEFLDHLIVVTAPEPLRILRVVQRDGIPEEQVLARMKHQLPEAEKVKLADYVIVNDGVQMLVPQVWQTHQALCRRV